MPFVVKIDALKSPAEFIIVPDNPTFQNVFICSVPATKNIPPGAVNTLLKWAQGTTVHQSTGRALPPQINSLAFFQHSATRLFGCHLAAFQRVARARLEFESVPDDRITGNLVGL